MKLENSASSSAFREVQWLKRGTEISGKFVLRKFYSGNDQITTEGKVFMQN